MTRTRENKTNAMRLLDQRGISYVAHRYNDSITTAAGVAGALGVPVDQVFKTLVLQGPEVSICCSCSRATRKRIRAAWRERSV
ncbi:MAG: hypothetical protein NVS4B2_22430 [Chloroflexota bacterium]